MNGRSKTDLESGLDVVKHVKGAVLVWPDRRISNTTRREVRLRAPPRTKAGLQVQNAVLGADEWMEDIAKEMDDGWPTWVVRGKLNGEL
jgi:hypothetical protein